MKQIFNPNADDFANRKLIGGENTNILNLANLKYNVFIDRFYKAFSNNWLPDRVQNISEDKIQYNNVLTNDEKRAYNLILSYLVFLDSVQTTNLPNISDKITDPEAVVWLARQTYDESLHSYSYGYLLKNMLSEEEFNNIIYLWRDDEVLLNRNKYIADLYDKYKADNSPKASLVVMVANFLLEGLYFYNGFMFFHNLAYQGKVIASNTMIAYIKRDEIQHCIGFKDMLKIFKEENPDDWDEELIYDLFKEAVKQELAFSNHAIGNNILGMSENTIEDYSYYLTNRRLKEIGLEPIFPERKSPYVHLEKYASVENENTNVANNFEKTSINYKSPEVFKGWENM